MSAKAVQFEVDGLVLRGKQYSPKQSKKLAVLFLHGWTGRPNEAAAKTLASQGFNCLTFSMSGHNDSDGKIEEQTRQKSLEETVVAYDFFKSKLPLRTNISVAGNSYGSYMAALLSTERKLASLSIRVPANYPDEGFNKPQLGLVGDNEEAMLWRDEPLDFHENKALKAVHNFKGPIQIIEAGDDDILPGQTVQNYSDAVEDTRVLEYHYMGDWPHSLGDDPIRNHRYQQMLLEWLNQQV